MASASGITIDARKFFARMKIYDEKYQAAIRDGLTQSGLHLEQKAKALAPKLEGHLEGSIRAMPVKFDGRRWTVEVHAGTDSLSAPYAIRRHEDVYDPGPITRAKPPDEAGPAGRKYLTRPLLHYSKRYFEHIARLIKALR